MKNKFYNFSNANDESVDLFISGEIVDDEEQTLTKAFFGEGLGTCPSEFIDELKENAGKKVNVYIDSYGGDVFAASSIYSALKEHDAEVVVKITGVAASAASVIAMAGSKVLMSKTAVMMIHNPSTGAYGDHNEMEKTIEILETVKNSIINAYEAKTGLTREVISDLMEKETWMEYDLAKDYGFCDGLIEEKNIKEVVKNCIENRRFVYNSLYGKKKVDPEDVSNETEPETETETEDDAVVKEQLDRYMDLLTKK